MSAWLLLAPLILPDILTNLAVVLLASSTVPDYINIHANLGMLLALPTEPGYII